MCVFVYHECITWALAVHIAADIRAFLISILMPILIFLFIIMIWIWVVCPCERMRSVQASSCTHTCLAQEIRLCWLLASALYLIMFTFSVWKWREKKICAVVAVAPAQHINIYFSIQQTANMLNVEFMQHHELLTVSLIVAFGFSFCFLQKFKLIFVGGNFFLYYQTKWFYCYYYMVIPWFL